MSNGGRVELLEMDELCLKEKDHRPGRENLNKYKLQIHLRILEDSHIIYRNDGESLRYILILGETYVLNVRVITGQFLIKMEAKEKQC